jgi:acyl-CoA synthetase (AMP-forming)/AMP-acid ligase II
LAERNGVVSSGQPLSGVSLRVEGGAIAIRSPALFSGYLGEAPPKLDSEGFWLTSDHGELGANGELYVRGRNDDVIISGGENIDPSEVEAAISALPGVKAVCVIGSPSLRFGQVVSALLVSDDPALGEPAHLAGLLAERLARHKWPRRVLLAESLPLTSSGKVDRRAASEHCRVHFRDTPER